MAIGVGVGAAADVHTRPAAIPREECGNPLHLSMAGCPDSLLLGSTDLYLPMERRIPMGVPEESHFVLGAKLQRSWSNEG